MDPVTFTGEVHPVAELFPMLADDELADLADDIAVRGLLQPIVLDPAGRLLDGRNRLTACEKAGVEPTFTVYDGDDPNGYALVVNITRRHLSTGARAVIAAQASRLNGTSYKSVTDDDSGLNKVRLSEAALVLDWAPALAPAVIAGVTPLSKAVEQARAVKRDAEALQVKLDRLADAASDLRSLVDDGDLDVNDAVAALDAREEKSRQEAAEAERQAEEQHQRERLAREQALGRWSELNDHIVAALAWAKQHEPPVAIPDQFPSVNAVADRLRSLAHIADGWES